MSHDVQDCARKISELDASIKRLTIQLGVKGKLQLATRLNELLLQLQVEFETSKNAYNTVLAGAPSSTDRPSPVPVVDPPPGTYKGVRGVKSSSRQDHHGEGSKKARKSSVMAQNGANDSDSQ